MEKFMPLPPFQNHVSDFVNAHNLETAVGDRMLDLTSEIGELAKEVLKATNYGRHGFHPNDSWRNELGDVFFSLICLANSTNIDLREALTNVLNKYQARLDANQDAGSDVI
jgi:NTP pyrophosphatase (non-canonical NTP hydrolase)